MCLDNLSSGIKSRIPTESEFINLDIRDDYQIQKLLKSRQFEGIVHLAALKSVEDSITNPSQYFETNFEATKELLDLAIKENMQHFIFSSTAAVYGNGDPKNAKISELYPPSPISPYGFSKLEAENALSESLSKERISGVSLRYFNVAGATNSLLRDNSVSNLIPKVAFEIRQQINPKIFGNSYPTADGTCIRDFIHVEDVARAHLLCAIKSKSDEKLPPILNIGSGEGYSVKEVIHYIQNALGTSLEVEIYPPRDGDPAQLVADVGLAKKLLEFDCLFGIQEMIQSAILE